MLLPLGAHLMADEEFMAWLDELMFVAEKGLPKPTDGVMNEPPDETTPPALKTIMKDDDETMTDNDEATTPIERTCKERTGKER